MRKLKKIDYGVLHFYAKCDSCGWSYSIGADNISCVDVENESINHVVNTGHKVSIETGTAFDFIIDENK